MTSVSAVGTVGDIMEEVESVEEVGSVEAMEDGGDAFEGEDELFESVASNHMSPKLEKAATRSPNKKTEPRKRTPGFNMFDFSDKAEKREKAEEKEAADRAKALGMFEEVLSKVSGTSASAGGASESVGNMGGQESRDLLKFKYACKKEKYMLALEHRKNNVGAISDEYIDELVRDM